ncbi:Calcium-activated chloride channel regulator 4 [Nymphon striatum]|nr:Calcium-activated chloride channel regulator 4 [Nymphon striatum]
MCMLVSCISIIYISCEQLYAVVRPFSFKQIQTKTTIISAAVMWIIAISLSLPLFFLRVYTDYHYNDGTIAGCSFSQKMKKIKYLLIITVLMVYVPCVVATIAYTIIICKLEKYNRLLMNKVHTLKIKFRNKVIRMFFIVLLVHLLCWLPLQILILYAAYRPDQGSQLPQWYLVYFTYFAHYLVFLHCAINPFIYGIRNENIKKALLKSFPFLAKKFRSNRVIPTTIVININNGTGTMKGIVITLISVAVFAVQGEIKLTKDNGYEGITIVVENHQEQHEDFFPALKNFHWENAQTTLDPFVAYHCLQDRTLNNLNIVVISDSKDHSTAEVNQLEYQLSVGISIIGISAYQLYDLLLQNASNFLYSSTGQVAYFGNVTVVIPSHWEVNGTEQVTFVDSPIPLTAGDIRIDFPNPTYENEPYTLQPRGCSEPGNYIHMTMDFILNVNGTMQEDFGYDLGRQLVHEWAHFRYGVFDEYGGVKNKMYAQFYIDGDDYRPVTCGENVPGYFEKKDGSNCTLDEDFKNGDCIFIPDESTAKITSSIMYLPYLHSITQFCDATIKNGHNYLAPSPQNIKCEYTPTWTVIAGHNDFRNLDKKNFKETNLKIIQPHVFAEPRFVIVMDVSGSMGSQDDPEVPTVRLEYLRIAVTRFLSTIVPDNSEVGLVEFTSTATTLTDLRKINSTSRTQLISKLPIQPLDETCIGCGLRKAIAVLSSNGQTAAGGTIILVTDGYNSGGYASIPDVMEEVLKAEVVVNAIAIGNVEIQPIMKVNVALDQVDRYTYLGQLISIYRDWEPEVRRRVTLGALLQLDQAFVVSVHNQRDVETADIQLFMNSVKLNGHQKKYYDITIDSSLGNDTTFVIAGHSGINWIQTSVISPDHHTYTENDILIYKYDKVAYTKTFKFSNAVSGKWKLLMDNTNVRPGNVSLIVTSKQRKKHSVPITVRCWLNNTVVDLSKSTNVVVFCHVLKGYNAVIKATVYVNIIDPLQHLYTLRLFDDGSGADSEANDGVYTAHFTEFKVDNRYSVTGTVTNDGKAQILKGTPASPAPRRFSGI